MCFSICCRYLHRFLEAAESKDKIGVIHLLTAMLEDVSNNRVTRLSKLAYYKDYGSVVFLVSLLFSLF